jgi:hypothetical protein
MGIIPSQKRKERIYIAQSVADTSGRPSVLMIAGVLNRMKRNSKNTRNGAGIIFALVAGTLNATASCNSFSSRVIGWEDI